MENILKNFKFGKILAFLYRLFWFYKSDNTENFLKANMPKVALCDPNDSLVTDYSSLKSALSYKYILNKDLKIKQSSILLYCLDNSTEKYAHFVEILYMIFANSHSSDFNSNRIRNSIKRISKLHNNLFTLRKKTTTNVHNNQVN